MDEQWSQINAYAKEFIKTSLLLVSIKNPTAFIGWALFYGWCM